MSEERIFVTADLHLGHENIIKYCKRPFADVEEMNETLIINWNNLVSNNDRVFFLGDFALSRRDNIITWGNRLNGRKVMIYGNHDHQRPKVYYEAGFEHVSKWPIIIQNKFILSHAPLHLQDSELDIGSLINIYGHIHNDEKLGPTISKKSACVCVERWNYKPVEMTEIEKLLEGM